MELVIAVLAVVAVVLMFELAAVLFGADTRPGITDDRERHGREDWI